MLNALQNRVLVDSNVLVYAYQPDERRHAASIGIIDRVFRDGTGVLSVQNLAEFCNVVHSKAVPSSECDKISRFVANLCDVYPTVQYGAQTIAAALVLAGRHRVHFFDALLAATMLENGITTIYTENAGDFTGIPGIRAVNPFA